MCGFFFYIQKKNINSSLIKKLKKTTDLIKHRGPDSKQYFIKNNIFAGFYRLSVQDLNIRSNQPFFSPDKRYMLLFNGMIYNFKEIKLRIKNKFKFQTSSDTEVLLALYILFGKKIFDDLKGMYSFLIYDFLKDKIIFSRDPYGQKPLYYFQGMNQLIVSSEIKPIQKLLNLSINNHQLKEYFLTNNYGDKNDTLFKGIKIIRGGEYALFKKFNTQSNNHILIKKFFSKKNLMYKKFPGSISELNKIIPNIITNHVTSDADVGVALSSGIDSRSICAILKKLNNLNKIKKAYFIDFKNFHLEKKDVIEFCNKLNIELKIININPRDIKLMFEKSLLSNELPLLGIMHIALFKMFKQVKKDGLKVMLGGYGLDEALGGYDSLNPKLFLKNLIKNKNTLIDGTLLNNDMLIKDSGKKKSLQISHLKVTDAAIHKKQLKLIFNNKLPRTFHMIDRASMSSSIEFRSPYMYPDFIKTSLSLNKKDYFEGTLGKMPIRNYLKSKYPHENWWFQIKKSVQTPQSKWLLTEELKPWINRIIYSESLYNKNNYLHKKKIQMYWSDFKSGKIKLGLPIWQLINIYYLTKNFK